MSPNDREPVPEPPDPRRPYRKPVIRKIALRPEDAVLGACKSPSQPMCNRIPRPTTLGS